MPLDDAVACIKRHLGLRQVRIATSQANGAADGTISSIALCPGAGGSVLTKTEADLLWTGEMRHHDVLAAQARGQHVVLCEHSNTERGYLPVFAERVRDLAARAGLDLSARPSVHDRDPHEFS